MLGFPGETREQFENTLRLVEEVRYDAAFMFAYSPREGTRAAGYPDQISEVEKMSRLNALIALQNGITEEINRAQVGRVYEVLVEGRSPKDSAKWSGLNRQGKTINFTAGAAEAGPDSAPAADLTGRLVHVRATQAHLWGFSGELVDFRGGRRMLRPLVMV